MNDWTEITITKNVTIREAMVVIAKGAIRAAFVVDSKMNLKGIVTDGDVRRGLLKNLDMSDSIGGVINSKPTTVDESTTIDERLRIMEDNDLLALPVVDSQGRLVGISTFKQLHSVQKLDNPVFIMAGGFGKRLHPLTENCPKPMLLVDGKPMLSYLLSRLIRQGFYNFYISTHYLADVIKDYFGDGSDLKCNITYVTETVPLGTGGAIGLLEKKISDLPMIVVNGDVLTDVDFVKLLAEHVSQNNDATMCVRELEHQVAYGVIETKNSLITRMVEKPTYRYQINAGMYVLNQSIIKLVESNRVVDLPTILNEVILQGYKVGIYAGRHYWLDIGSKSDYEKAQIDIKTLT